MRPNIEWWGNGEIIMDLPNFPRELPLNLTGPFRAGFLRAYVRFGS